MTQKTIKALYKQPVNYKLMKDGYKTIKGVINAQDGMPKILDLPTPSELYESDLVYNVDTSVNGAPIITTNSFTLPDDETCESKQYCYATKGTNYNYISKEIVRYYDNFTVVGSPQINYSTGIVSNFGSDTNYLQLNEKFNPQSNYKVVIKFTTASSFPQYGRICGAKNQYSMIPFYFNYDNLGAYGSSNGSSWNLFSHHHILTLSTNTTYILMFEYTGSACIWYQKQANDWVEITRVNCTSAITSDYFIFGKMDNGNTWAGSIDLKECYIEVDNKIWWKSYTDHEEEVVTQIPGMLDSSVTTDNWQQNQEYKLYQLKNQNNTNTLQLTTNNITDTEQKYKQYVQQLTIPARTYKWYYNGIPEESYPSYYAEGEVVVSNGVASNFGESSFIDFNVYPRYYEEQAESFTTIIEFETGNSVTNHSLLELVNWHYNSTLDRYTEEMIYFSCIHNGKFSTTDDGTLTTFNDGTTLSPNTKYWMALYLTDESARTYLIPDSNYTPETLPSLSSWTLENTITFSESMNIYYNEWFFGCYSDFSGENVQYNAFNGKLFVDNMLAFDGLTLDPAEIIWEPYYYYNYIYRWYANKSLYTYSENQNYADTLDFSDSWLNVTSNWKTQKKYVNPNVCLMPIDGGETNSTTIYTPNGTLEGNVKYNNYTSALSNFSQNNYMALPESFSPGSYSWEICFKFKTSHYTSVASNVEYFLGTTNGNNSVLFEQSNGTFHMWLSSNGSSWNIASYIGGGYSVLPDTIYYIKIVFNGSNYILSASTDNITWTTIASVASSTKIATCYTFYIGSAWDKSTGYLKEGGEIYLSESYIKINDAYWWNGATSSQISNGYILPSEGCMPGCLYNYTDEGQQHNFDVYYDPNYTQPILVSSGQSYSAGTKVDTITIPAHRTWAYTTGGNWSKITYVDTSYSNYTYTDGNLVLTEYTGSDTDVIVPNAVI